MQDFYDIYDTTIDPMDYGLADVYPFEMEFLNSSEDHDHATD